MSNLLGGGSMGKKGMTEIELMLSIFLLLFGFFTAVRGLYWLISSDSAMEYSPFYQAVDAFMPLPIWGLVYMLAGILFVLASLTMYSHKTRKLFFGFVTSSGLISSMAYFILAIISVDNAQGWMVFAQYMILWALGGGVAVVGGNKLWQTI